MNVKKTRDLKTDLKKVYKDINDAQVGEQKYVKIEIAREWLERAISAEDEIKAIWR